MTILTLCAGAESGLRGEAVAQQTDFCPIFKLLKWCVIAETKHGSGERSLLLYGSQSCPLYSVFSAAVTTVVENNGKFGHPT